MFQTSHESPASGIEKSSPLAHSLLVKAFGYAGPLPIIAIGPQGGKIVGYDSLHKPIYAGSHEYEKLLHHLEQGKKLVSPGVKTDVVEDGHKVVDWLAHLHVDAKHHGTAAITVGPNNAKKLTEAFGIHPIATFAGAVHFKLDDLWKHVGKPLGPPAPQKTSVVAALSAGAFGDDAPFTEDKLKSLKVAGDLGGSHGGKIVADSSGNQYAWKTNKGHQWVSRAEEVFCRVAKLAFPKPSLYPHAEFVESQGQKGVLMSWVGGTALGKESSGHSVADTKLQKHWLRLVQHQVLDWLMANHDSHGANFHVVDGDVVALDKGQAFKGIGSDVLSATYHFPGNGSSPVYNQLWAAHKAGQLKGDPVMAVEEVMQNLAKLSEEQYMAIVEPYLEALSQSPIAPSEVAKKREAIRARFQNIRKDWEQFLTKQLGHPVALDLSDVKGKEVPAPTMTVQAAPTSEFVHLHVPPGEPASITLGTLSDDGLSVSLHKPGWPKTFGTLTVHHPGDLTADKKSWPSKYPGPGYHATVKYKGKSYEVEFSVAPTLGNFIGKLTYEVGGEKKTITAQSPQQIADTIILLEKKLPLDTSSSDMKFKHKIGYSMSKLLKLDEFNEALKEAGSAQPTVAAETVKELEAEHIVAPEQKTLSLHEMLKGAPNGVLADPALMPHSLQEFVKSTPFSGLLDPTQYDGIPPGMVLKATGKTGAHYLYSAQVQKGAAQHFVWKIEAGVTQDKKWIDPEFGIENIINQHDGLKDIFQKIKYTKQEPKKEKAPWPAELESPQKLASQPLGTKVVHVAPDGTTTTYEKQLVDGGQKWVDAHAEDWAASTVLVSMEALAGDGGVVSVIPPVFVVPPSIAPEQLKNWLHTIPLGELVDHPANPGLQAVKIDNAEEPMWDVHGPGTIQKLTTQELANAWATKAAPVVITPPKKIPEVQTAPLATGTTITKQQKGLGEVKLEVVGPSKFVVTMPGGAGPTSPTTKHEFKSLGAASDHVWAVAQGHASAADYKEQKNTNKVPSGAGWKFWGLTADQGSKILAGVPEAAEAIIPKAVPVTVPSSPDYSGLPQSHVDFANNAPVGTKTVAQGIVYTKISPQLWQDDGNPTGKDTGPHPPFKYDAKGMSATLTEAGIANPLVAHPKIDEIIKHTNHLMLSKEKLEAAPFGTKLSSGDGTMLYEKLATPGLGWRWYAMDGDTGTVGSATLANSGKVDGFRADSDTAASLFVDPEETAGPAYPSQLSYVSLKVGDVFTGEGNYASLPVGTKVEGQEGVFQKVAGGKWKSVNDVWDPSVSGMTDEQMDVPGLPDKVLEIPGAEAFVPKVGEPLTHAMHYDALPVGSKVKVTSPSMHGHEFKKTEGGTWSAEVKGYTATNGLGSATMVNPDFPDVVSHVPGGTKGYAALEALPVGTLIAQGAVKWFKGDGGYWHASGSSAPPVSSSELAQVGSSDIQFQPGVPGWKGALYPKQEDLDALPVGSMLIPANSTTLSYTKHEHGWSVESTNEEGAVSPGTPMEPKIGTQQYSVKLPSESNLTTVPTVPETAQGFDSVFGITPIPPTPKPVPIAKLGLFGPVEWVPAGPATPSIQAAPQPKIVDTLEALPAPVAKKVEAAWKQITDDPQFGKKSGLWEDWVPPPGAIIEGEHPQFGKFWVTEALAGHFPDGKPGPLVKFAVFTEGGKTIVPEDGEASALSALKTALVKAGVLMTNPAGEPLMGNFDVLAMLNLSDAKFPADSTAAVKSPPPVEAVVPSGNFQNVPQSQQDKAVTATVDLESLLKTQMIKAKYGFFKSYKPKPDSANGKYASYATYLSVKVKPGGLDPVTVLNQFLKDHGLEHHVVAAKPPAVSKFNEQEAWCIIKDEAFQKPTTAVTTVQEASEVSPVTKDSDVPFGWTKTEVDVLNGKSKLGQSHLFAILSGKANGTVLALQHSGGEHAGKWVKVTGAWASVVDGVVLNSNISTTDIINAVGLFPDGKLVPVETKKTGLPQGKLTLAQLEQAPLGQAVWTSAGKWTHVASGDWTHYGTGELKNNWDLAASGDVHGSVALPVGSKIKSGDDVWTKDAANSWSHGSETGWSDAKVASYPAKGGDEVIEVGPVASATSGVPAALPAGTVLNSFDELNAAPAGTTVVIGSWYAGNKWTKQSSGKWKKENPIGMYTVEEMTSVATEFGEGFKVVDATTAPPPPAAVPYAFPSKMKLFKKDGYKNKEKLLEFPVGTKLTFANGNVIEKTEKTSNGGEKAWKWFSHPWGNTSEIGSEYTTNAVSSFIAHSYGQATITPPNGQLPQKKPPPPPPPPKSPEQIAAEKAALEHLQKEAADKAAKAKAYLDWLKDHPKPTDPKVLAALAKFQVGLSGKFYAHEDGDKLLIGGGQAPVILPGATLQVTGLVGAHGTVETPLGNLFQVTTAHFLNEYGPPPDVAGPDGKSYPAGTTFTEEQKPLGSKEQTLKNSPNFHKFVPHSDDPTKSVAKFTGSATPVAIKEAFQKAKLTPHPVQPGAPLPLKGGSNWLVAVDKKELTEPAGFETVVTPKIPPQPAPWSPAPPPFSMGPQAQGEAAVINSHDIDSLHTVKPTEWGHAIRIGQPGVLMDPQLRVKKVKKDGQEFFEIYGELLEFNPMKSSGMKQSGTAHQLFCSGKKDQFDPNSDGGYHEVKDLGAQSFSGSKGETDGGTTFSVAHEMSGHKNPRAHANQFIARIPVTADVRSELGKVFTAMGQDATKALAPHDENAERVWIKQEIVRCYHDSKWWFSVANRRHFGDEKWLDKQLTELGAAHLVAGAKIVVGGGNTHRVILDDITDEQIEKDKCRFLATGTAMEAVIHHVGMGQGSPARKQAYFNGTMQTSGAASDDDYSGGAYGTMVRLTRGSGGVGSSGCGASASCHFIYHPRILKRTDYQPLNSDCYGSITEGTGHGYDPLPRSMATKTPGHGNEFIFKNGVDLKDVAGIRVDSESGKKEFIMLLKKANPKITEVNGIPLSEFVFVAPKMSHGDADAVVKACKGLQPGVLK